MIIDFHAHMGAGPAGSQDLLQSNITPEMIIEPAREAGIDATVVFPVTYPTYLAANREIMDAVAQYPAELIGFARLNPTTENAVGELEAAVEGGLRGLKLHHGCDGFDLDCEQVHAVLDRCAELSWPVVFHSGGAVPELVELAGAHPETTVVFGHMGCMWDWQAARQCIAAAQEMDNVLLETSSMMVIWMVEEAGRAVPDKVLFGSDAPAMHPKVELEKVRCARLPDETKARISGHNAATLLGLP
ncbi:MAG: amidohydrolase family protein [Armatimonadota bacterium]